MLICEMAAYYRKKGKTLDQVINKLYDEFGYYYNKTEAFEFEGSEGMKTMANIMSTLRQSHPKEIAGFKVTRASDYLNSRTKDIETEKEKDIDLPKSNVLAYELEGGGSVIVRPSGTEPKIKVYITSVGESEKDAVSLADKMISSVIKTLGIPEKKDKK